MFHLHVSSELLLRAAQEVGQAYVPRLSVDGRDQVIVSTAAWLLSELGGETVVPRILWSTAAHSIAFRLLRSDASHAPSATYGGLAPWQTRRTTEFLQAHLASEVGLSELADIAQLSTFHFARQFKKTTGLPPHAYQRRLRCQRAKELLASTSLSVGEIAAAVGYETPQAFARMFRAEVGVTPTEYRRDAR